MTATHTTAHRTTHRTARRIGACVLLLAIAIVTTGAGAAAAGMAPAPALAPARKGPPSPCQTAAVAAQRLTDVPWAQDWFSPDRVWTMGMGAGVKVAVIDSGVDATHPQLATGNVLSGLDLLRPGADGGNVDCDGHGTAVASLIAAGKAAGVGFTGLAPDAKILPVRVADQDVESGGAGQDAPVDPNQFALGIFWAVNNGARVINMSVVFYRDFPAIRAAIRYAVARDVVLVAAVGNRPTTTSGPAPTPYPAAYDGVLGVGAIRQDGTLAPTSATGPWVDLVAPGDAVTAAARGGGHRLWTGTSFAAPFVSAAAAVLLGSMGGGMHQTMGGMGAAMGGGTGSGSGMGGGANAGTGRPMTAAEAEARLIATADPAGQANQFGHGVVDPFRALSERLDHGMPAAPPPLPRLTADPQARLRAARWHRAGQFALAVAALAVAVGALAALAVPALTRGRRRRFAPAHWPGPPAAPPPVDEPERVFYTVPSPSPPDGDPVPERK